MDPLLKKILEASGIPGYESEIAKIMKDELKKKDNELTSKILKDVLDITKKVGGEKGYSLILQASQQIVYIDQAIDITDEVLKRYDSGK